jgi:hypothetical protein
VRGRPAPVRRALRRHRLLLGHGVLLCDYGVGVAYRGTARLLNTLCSKRTRTLCLAAALCTGCSSEPPADGHLARTFDEVFGPASTITLEEDSTDVVGEVGEFIEAHDGSFLIADAQLPRLRKYGPDGDLLGAIGRFGAGPFEFRRIAGLAEDEQGRILAVDPVLGRVTVLTRDLAPDTTIRPTPPPRGAISWTGEGIVLKTSSGPRTSSLSGVSPGTWDADWSVLTPVPGSIFEYPYWGSVATTPFAAAPGALYLAYSLLNTVYAYDLNGRLQDSIPMAIGSFTSAPVVEAGAFGGPGGRKRLEEWLGSFDVIAEISVVDGRWLVLTRGRLQVTPTRFFTEVHDQLDIYEISTGKKVAEGVAIPKGSRVLGGGTALYLLVSSPPGPWTIQKVQIELPVSVSST